MNIRHNIKRVMLLAVLLLTVGSVANANVKVSRVADAQKAVSISPEILYVITDDNSNFLAVKDGELTTATIFNPNTCVWTCSAAGGGTMSIGSKYLYCTTDGSLSLTDNNTCEWTVNGDGSVSWTSGSTSYYIYYGGSWTTSTSLSDITAASCYSTTLATNDAVSAMTLNYDEFTSSSFGRFNGDTRTYNIGNFSYTPAYCVYSWMNKSGVQKVFYTNEDKSMVTTTAPKDFSLSDASITWTSSHSNVTITADGDDASKAEAKYTTKFSEDTEVTFTATATIAATKSDYISSDVTLTATDKVTMYKLLANKLELSFALDNDKHDKLYVNETATLTVAANTSGGAVTYSLSDAAMATLDGSTGKLTANGVNEANGANEAVLVVTATTPETDEYEAGSATIHVTVSKRPTDIDFSYSGNSLTCGDAAPALTSIRVNDELANGALESPTLRYSSNNECVGVDASTGALTIKRAGTATITATYAGDGTYASSTATYQITVSKCATTLTFPAEAYYAQVDKDFTSPVATLTPSDAGEVTYSYTSETAGLLSLDTETGEVTINTTTGTAIITATFAGNNSYEAATASYTLLVDMKELPELTVNIEGNTFYVGKTSTVTAKTNASNGVTFESTDTDVFTITSKGAFTAVAEGQATLRITSVEDDTYMEYVVEMPITVKRYPVNLTLSYPQSTYYTDHGVDNIIPTVIAKDGVNNEEFSVDGQITFSTAQTSVVTVDATTGRVALVAPGNAVVTVSYAGTDHYSPTTASFSILVKYAAGPGQFVRLKDADGNYMSCNHGSDIGTTTDKDASTIIWYGTDRSLLFYSCGRYLKNADKELADVVNAGEAGPTFLFTHNGDDYTISDGKKDMPSGTSDDGVWIVETVDELPLTFSEGGYGYSTFYSPVNLRCPAGVTAYYPSARSEGTDVDYVITLKSVTGNYIPSNTPVVLYTQTIGTYRMSQIEAEETTYTDLWDGMKGTLPMVNTASVYSGTQCPYTLQANASSSVGFYPWTSEHTTISAFRCYIPGESVSDAKSFRFVFDGNTTGIDNVSVDSPDSSSTIYNLHGIAVGTDFNALPSGVYIRGGKKMMKK